MRGLNLIQFQRFCQLISGFVLQDSQKEAKIRFAIMLRIRFSRTGKPRQPSFRIVVAEHSAPVKGRNIEIVGNYAPSRNPKITTINKERVAYWISRGAIPTDATASLFKKEGIPGMEKYLEPRDKKRKSKAEKKAEAESSGAKKEKPESAGAKEPEGKKPEEKPADKK